MTSGEIMTHILAACGTAGPAIGAFISERTKRKTAEAQTTEHVAKAISDATAGIRVTLETTAAIARGAMAKATESEQKVLACEEGRESEQQVCAEQLKGLKTELEVQKVAELKRDEVTRGELEALRELIVNLTPSSTIHNGVVE